MKKILIIILVLLILGAIGYYIYIRFFNGKLKFNTTDSGQNNIVQIDVNNKFGWLGADESESNFDDIVQMGGGWMRPHPGQWCGMPCKKATNPIIILMIWTN